jgi:hypothetical protein
MNDLIGMVATFGNVTYMVRGWYLDANGCLKTYGEGYSESFVEMTTYGV